MRPWSRHSRSQQLVKLRNPAPRWSYTSSSGVGEVLEVGAERAEDLTGDVAFEFPESTLGLCRSLAGLVGARVVGGAVVPAGPDDSQPGAGDDAEGVGVAFAAGAGVGIELCGPG